MTDIFISYASEDRSRIEPLAKALEDQGWTVFWDRTIPAGKTWRQVIGEALETARSVIVAWSETSVESSWVQEEADRGRERNILIPILIDNVKPPLGFGAIQAADLVSWEPTQSSPEFEKLISDLSANLGPSPLKVRETEQKRAEEELRLQQDEEEERRKKQQRKAEEARERKDAEAKRKAEEEQKRKVLKAEIKPDKPEPSEIKPSAPRPDVKAPTGPRPSPPIPSKSRRSRNALIFGAVAGAIVLLIIALWLMTFLKIGGLKEKVEALKVSAADIDNQEQLGKFSNQRKDLSDQVEATSQKAAIFGLKLRFEELQNLLKQVQIQEETLFKIEGFKEQVKELEGAVAKVDKLEQIEKLYSHRDTLNKQVAALKEQATKVGLELQFGEFQDRLKNFNSQLAKKKEELIAARKARIFVASAPANATIKILNIDEPFQQGMGLEPGRYHVRVSSEGFEPQDRWIELGPGDEKRISFELEKIVPKVARLFVETVPKDATVRILNIRPKFYQGMELEAGSYHVEVEAEGYLNKRQWIDLDAGKEKRISFELEKIAPKLGRLFIETMPANAIVKILNIDQGFRQGMELEPGKYHVKVSHREYEPQDRWIELGPGEEKRINFELGKIAPNVAWLHVETIPEDATVKILNIRSKFSQGIELEPGIYHVEVAAEGYETERQKIELGPGEEKRISFELKKLKKPAPALTGPARLRIQN
jgi:hypothetical protein